MKNKPQKHKETNLFKFKSFAEQISGIDIRQNALYHINHVNENAELDENATLFHQTYLKWHSLNLSEEYNVFQKQIRDVVTLPQLLHQKDRIISLLLNKLKDATTLSLQPLLEFTVILAKDLREEFYEYFPLFLTKLIQLLDTKDTDQLEWTLICLAYLFKVLKPFLKKDISVVFNLCLPLLTKKNAKHVQNFAVECFSFVVRDIKDTEKFLNLVVTNLKDNLNGIKGCGRLFFEMIKGINGGFNNCAKRFLDALFSNISNVSLDQNILFDIIRYCIYNLLSYIDPKNMQTLWNACVQQLKINLQNTTENDQSIEKIVILMGEIIDYKNGKYLADSNSLIIEQLFELAGADVSDKTIICISDVISKLLLSTNINMTQLDASRLTKKILSVSSPEIFEIFIRKLFSYSEFEIFMLPEVIAYFDQYCEKDDQRAINLLTELVLAKSPMCTNGINMSTWNRFPLPMKINGLRYIEKTILNGDINNCEETVLCTIIYPHIIQEKKQTENIVKRISAFIHTICEKLNSNIEPAHYKDIFLLSILIENQIHIGKTLPKDMLNVLDTLIPLSQKSSPALSAVLGIIDMILGIQMEDDLDKHLFERIHKHLAFHLSSPQHIVRLLVTHIFKSFTKVFNLNRLAVNIYEIFYNIENTVPTTKTYRTNLMYIQKLSPDAELFQCIRSEIYENDPLRYLLGALYINFNLIWKPIGSLISSYTEHINVNEFWQIFRMQLDEANQNIRNGINASNDDDKEKLCTYKQFTSFWEINDRVDWINYRQLLWKMIPNFGNLIDLKNREISTLFLDFIDVEYNKYTEGMSNVWNVVNRNVHKNDADAADDDNVDADAEDDDEADDNDENDTTMYENRKTVERTLITMISVFPNMPNPKQIYRESDLNKLYLNLLNHRNSYIQKLALDCIMAYKHKYLIPYKNELYGIIDDAKLKETIVSFNINEESNMILPEHRAKLIPLLIRITYSKLIAKAQKGTGNMRKNLILRFLGGCTKSEIIGFLQMAFGLYENYFNTSDGNISEISEKVHQSIDLKAIISPKKLQSSLNLIETIREQFAGLMGDEFVQYLLKVLFVIGSIVARALSQMTELNAISVKLFKMLRNMCLNSLSHFFNQFESYQWSDMEIEGIFKIFISPILMDLPKDGIHSPTPLLKLLTTFSENPRYFILFTKSIQIKVESGEAATDCTPLRYMFDLLLKSNTKPRVCLAIMEIIQNLLFLKTPPATMENPIPDITALNCRLPIQNADINYGSQILIPYINDILEKYRQNLSKRYGLTKRDVLILSRCTELVFDSQTSETLLALLMPILIKKSQFNVDDEVLAQSIQTISNLIDRIENAERFIKDIAVLFEKVTAVGVRKQLCTIFEKIANRTGSNEPNKQNDIQILSSFIIELNSWDRRWVEQPDYERRLMAYKKIGELEDAEQLNLNLGLIIIYHSLYFIKHDKDIAMRDIASYHLKKTSTVLTKILHDQPHQLDYFINTILAICRKSISSNGNESIRNETITLLGELARECPQAHPVLSDLNILTNQQDREVDFFDNIIHLQHYRQSKALLKFNAITKGLESVPSPRTLTQFILPLANQYLLCEKHCDKHGLVTSAIETIGAVCKLLPWHQYELLLKYYLKKLHHNVQYQKQLVRVVVQILDSFHFDLSKANWTPAQIKAKSTAVVKASDANSEVETKKVDDPQQEEIVLGIDDDGDDLDLDEAPLEKDPDDIEMDNNIDNIGNNAKRVKLSATDQITVLSPGVAKRVIHTIAFNLVPTLSNSITKISNYEKFHKINKKKRKSEREEEEVLRIPIALAVVKLLQKLPDGLLDQSLYGIFIKVSTFLKSPLRSVRMIARDVLKNIMLAVGSKHLNILVNQLATLLTRGFQVHVLTVTIYSILDALKTKLKTGDIDPILQNVLQICLEDIFGQTSEEKKIFKITTATPEAKPSNKSYLTLHIIAMNITENCILDLLMPFKDYLVKHQSKAIVTKVQECFQKIVMGLILNKHLSIESLLMLIYGLASESIPKLIAEEGIKSKLSRVELVKLKQSHSDCFLIENEPNKRTTDNIIKTNRKTNSHVLVEFGLELFHILLKRGKLLQTSYHQYINPMVPLLADSLKSTQIQVTILSVKCLTSIWNRSMILPKMKLAMNPIVEQLFKILHQYATVGMSTSNENFTLVKSTFKSMVALIRYVEYYSITEEQLKVLLLYIEKDLYDNSKQTIAFSLLKVIIERKLIVPEVNDVMKKVCELAIISDNSAARIDAKSTLVNYLMEYPLGKKIDGFLKFLISNLSYEVDTGRQTVIQILQSIIMRFPAETLHTKCESLFLVLGAQLINDESTDCKEMIANTIEKLLQKLDQSHRDKLFDILLVLFADQKTGHQEMAAALCSRFISMEKEKFVNRIEPALRALLSTLSILDCNKPGQFVRTPKINDFSENNIPEIAEQKHRAEDHQVIQATNTIIKILENYNYNETLHKCTDYLDKLSYEAQRLLSSEHAWIRYNATKILGLILRNIDIQILDDIMNGIKVDAPMEYIYTTPHETLKSICLDLCAQLIPGETNADMTGEVIKVLLIITNMVKNVSCEKRVRNENEYIETEINVLWLTRRMQLIAHMEVSKSPFRTVLRTATFQWIEGVIEIISPDTLSKIVPFLMIPLIREMTDDDRNIDAKLKRLAIKVSDQIKAKLNEDEFNLLRTKLQRKLMIKRAERKKIIAQTKVTDPVLASLRKQGEQKRKRMAKKRKIDEIKGRTAPKKIRRNKTNEEDIF